MKATPQIDPGVMASSKSSRSPDTSATLQVYIRGDKGFWAIVPNVTLLDGCIPTIEDEVTGLPLDEKDLPCVEPAAWFKVFIFDSISIDCVHHMVHWNCDSAVNTIQDAVTQMNTPSAGLHQENPSTTQCLFVDVESREDEMGQLFIEIEAIINELREGLMSWGNFKKEVIRLLHCHVLPNIPVEQKHLPLVSSAYTRQTECVHQMDANIIKKYDMIDNIKKSLSRLMLKTIEDPKEFLNLPLDFAKTLYSDIKSDMEKSRRKYEGQQRAKQHSEDDTHAPKAFVPLDEHLKQLKLQEASFNLRDVLEKRSSEHRLLIRLPTKRISQNVLYQQYLGIREEVEQLKREIKAMVERKVLMMSVKEAIHLTLKKLREGGECVTIREQSTDVLFKSQLSLEWLTMSERISIILNDVSHPLAIKHTIFSTYVIESCQAALASDDEAQHSTRDTRSCVGRTQRARDSNSMSSAAALTDPWSDDEGPEDIFEENFKSQDIGDINTCFGGPITLCIVSGENRQLKGSVSSIQWQSNSFDMESETSHWTPSPDRIQAKDIYRASCALMRLKRAIQEHVRKMTKFLHLEIVEKGQACFKQIWLHYERHFYADILPWLIKLYTLAYSPICERMKNDYPTLTLAELSLEESILTAMLEDERNVFEDGQFERPVYSSLYPMRVQHGLESPPEPDTIPNLAGIDQEYNISQLPPSAPDVTFEETPSGEFVLHSKRQRLLCKKKTLRLRPIFRESFGPALDNIKLAIQSDLPYLKLKYLTKSLSEINKNLSVFQAEYSSHQGEMCDIVNLLVILLCNTNLSHTVALYPHLVFLADTLPPFFEGGQYSFFILQLIAAYQFIEDCLCTRRLEEEEETKL